MKKVYLVLLTLVLAAFTACAESEPEPELISTPEGAVECALDIGPYYPSPNFLREELADKGFDEEHIEYAMEHIEVDWKECLQSSVDTALNHLLYSEKKLRESLEEGGYPPELVEYGMSLVPEDMDWNEQARLSGKQYVETPLDSPNGMEKPLLDEGFTEEQVKYVASFFKDEWYWKAASYAEVYVYPKYHSDPQAGVERMMEIGFSRDDAEYSMAEAGNRDMSNRN